MKDAIVIGAGLSGLMGALVLAEAGHRPLLLATGNGTTHWTSGTVDIWGASSGVSLRESLHTLLAERPEHPYARVGMAGIEAGIARFLSLMEAAGYPYVGGLEGNVLLPTALGALRPAAYMPFTMAAGDTRQIGEVLIAGFRELRDFFPALIAANLQAQGIAARGVYLEVPAAFRRIDYSTRTFAVQFDFPAFQQDISRQLHSLRGSATHIGLPAVLGLNTPAQVIQTLQQTSGAQVFEIPTLPPSVPGMRLFLIFRDAINAAGGRLQPGSMVQRATGENGRLISVASAAAAREQVHRARAFLLATGGIAGGGLHTDYRGGIQETALGLPLHTPASRGDWFHPRFLHQQGHAIFQAGVITDERFRPVASAGDTTPIYENVVVAGQALACHDALHERCLTGLALTTGWRAGQILSEMLHAE